jgi:hypothetical protein
MNNTIARMAAILLSVESDLLFEKLPNMYPMMNTIHAAKSTLIKMSNGNMT